MVKTRKIIAVNVVRSQIFWFIIYFPEAFLRQTYMEQKYSSPKNERGIVKI